MIFPYLDINRGGAIRTHPIIPISLHGPGGSLRLYALVDPGAEQSVFSLKMDAPMILGQSGFFEFFNVTFRRRRWLMDIRRAR